MSRRRPLDVTSRLVSGDYDSFKAAMNRSLMGVTYVSNRRKPNISQSRRYNQVVVEEIIRYAHSKLQKELGPNIMKYLKLYTSLRIDWDSAGRIKEISDLRISAYSLIGQLDLGNIVFSASPEKILVDFFQSKVDAASPIVSSSLRELEQTMGPENVQINTYDFFTEEGRHKAQLLNVTKVPTVVINGSIVLENPTKNQIFEKVNERLTPSIKSSRADFMLEPSSRVVLQTLVSKKP